MRLATECLAFARDHNFVSHHVLVLDFGGATGMDPRRAPLPPTLNSAHTTPYPSNSSTTFGDGSHEHSSRALFSI